MELRHLRYFVAVAEERHFGRAATRLAMAQPPLSTQIKALERELGVELFHRGPRGVTLTAAGEAFAAGAYEALAVVERASVSARRAAAGELGRLHVGFVSSAAYGPLPDAVRRFRERYGGVSLSLEELSTDIQLRDLRGGALDVGLFRMGFDFAEEPSDELSIERIAREPFVLALPQDHPLAGREVLSLADVAADAFVHFPRKSNPSLHDQVARYCLSAGFVPQVVQEAKLMQTIVGLVVAGLGVALVPASLMRLQREGVVYRPLAEREVASEMVAVWRRDNPSVTLPNFLAVLRQGYEAA